MEPLIFIAVMVGLMWLLVIRPQRRRTTEHSRMVGELSVDDEIVTAGGLHGRIRAIEDDVLSVEIAPGTTVRIARGAVAGILGPGAGSGAAEPPVAPDDR